MTPTARTLTFARGRGWLVDVVERRITKILTKDLFGCIDLIALDGQPGVLGIQATSGSNGAARVKKIQTECREAAERWLLAGNRLEVWAWRKLKGPGKRIHWGVRVTQVTLETLEALEAGGRVDLSSNEG